MYVCLLAGICKKTTKPKAFLIRPEPLKKHSLKKVNMQLNKNVFQKKSMENKVNSVLKNTVIK